MAVATVAPSSSDRVLPGAWRWPQTWDEKESLLERQHEGIALLLADLLQRQGAPEDAACRRLLWQLRLHLRLEERWLEACGCLCPGHRQAHQEAARTAFTGYVQSASDPAARRQWLLELQGWFNGHCSGPDAHAYALAALHS